MVTGADIIGDIGVTTGVIIEEVWSRLKPASKLWSTRGLSSTRFAILKTGSCLGHAEKRWIHGAFNNAGADSVTGEPGRIMDSQFIHDILPMFLDRFYADLQVTGDLLVRFAFGDQLQHFHLTRTEMFSISTIRVCK